MTKGYFEINYYDDQGWLRISKNTLASILNNNYADSNAVITEAVSNPMREIRTSPYSYFRYNKGE